MTVEKLNPESLHQPLNNLYAHAVRATGSVHYRVGGQVPMGPTAATCTRATWPRGSGSATSR